MGDSLSELNSHTWFGDVAAPTDEGNAVILRCRLLQLIHIGLRYNIVDVPERRARRNQSTALVQASTTPGKEMASGLFRQVRT